MKSLLLFFLLITTVFSEYLSGLNRTFDEIELKVVDLYVTLPEAEVNNLIKITQITEATIKSGGARNAKDFEYEGAVIVAKWNGQEKTFENAKFKTGGMYARANDKAAFNIKLDKKFLGRKNIRLRPDPKDKSHLRSKLCCDIANRIGLPSIQASYARLYMNGEFWGLYTLMDAVKTSWIRQTFNPSETEIKTLYQCKNGGFNFKSGSYSKCVNANDDYPSMDAFKKFVENVSKCKTSEEVERFMDVDIFLKYLAFEWLIGSFDHFTIYGHNFNFYKRETDGKWVIIYYDYDNTFGHGLKTNYWASKGPNQDGSNSNNNTGNNGRGGMWGGNMGFGGGNNNNNRGNDPIQYSFADWELNIPIIKTIVYQNKDRFKEIVRHVLVSAFNPDLLNSHIEKLHNFLIPYVEEDSTPDKNGILPGRINRKGIKITSSVAEFENDIETSIKYWINTKFEVACKNYDFEPNDIINASKEYIPKPYDYSYSSPKSTKTLPYILVLFPLFQLQY
ncbi:coth-domain-containing protein [Anaeromyces robustus]|uniref:Coth-domain-containing protein n=1 Tax=Anaeromyces robustus TaxID=1754192 RepID=A0A1Y1XDN6_9FUNG|nr:coth-domain-containing protein [Anaeromyces robustus]|eukprot:ORX83868.1 coth-domain-containing protein [Anaeromyces robustus]